MGGPRRVHAAGAGRVRGQDRALQYLSGGLTCGGSYKRTHKADLNIPGEILARFCNFLDGTVRLGYGALCRYSARIGSSISKIEPLPRVDSTQIRPPCISTICLAMASPRPVPPLALVRELSTWWN